MKNNAYLKRPTVHGDEVCFVTDDDLWKVTKGSEIAVRLTSGKGIANEPHFSPNGKNIAYTSSVSGQRDLYVISNNGGIPERITYYGDLAISGWKNDSTIIFQSSHGTFSLRERHLFEVDLKTKIVKPLGIGYASALIQGPGKLRVLGRNLGNPARWKRYRGGTAGTLWVDKSGSNNFKQILTQLKTNICNPQWVGKRIYFISDHQGIGNVYSCDENGKNVKRHTDQDEYYVRSFDIDGDNLVYQCGADIWESQVNKKSNGTKLNIHVPSSFDQSIERPVYAVEDLHDYVLSEDAEELTCCVRGQLFAMPPWSGAPMRLGKENVRYKRPAYLYDEKKDELHLVAVGMEPEGEEELFLFDMDTLEKKKLGGKTDWGKIYQTVCSPDGTQIAVSNNRCELFIVSKSGKAVRIDRSNQFFFKGLNWSPDGRYLAYETQVGFEKTGIKIYDTKTKKSRMLITPVSYDGSPHFDPTGEYLYFCGVREFHPTYNETHFDLGFPFASKVYAVVLKKDGVNPLHLHLDFESEDKGGDEEEEEQTSAKEKKESKEKKTKAKKKEEDEDKLKVEIDFEGIDNRIVPLPIPLGGYRHVMVVKDKIYWLKEPVKGINPHNDRWGGEGGFELGGYDFKVKKSFHIDNGVWTMRSSRCKKYLMYDEGSDLRIIKTDQRPTEDDGYNRKDGYIDLRRIKSRIDPKVEWLQMYKEAWILQREHFWVKNMSKIDWKKVYSRYIPVLKKVHTRNEFSDLMWEMQGELGTSHAYEFMGDYHREVYPTRNGFLGGRFKWVEKEKAFEVLEVHSGDSWIPGADSPLNAPSVGLKKGDLVYGVDGQNFKSATSLDEALVGKAGVKVNLAVARKKEKGRGHEDQEFVVTETLWDEHMMLYRQWVDKNKEYVHKKSKGKLGYVHVPNMGAWGYSEFYRNFLSEVSHEGLVIDVRYNGGGHVSQHLLKILAQKKVGFDTTRYFGTDPYPMYAPGALVCLCNEHAGSDGDIFPHSFKLMKLGKLVGKRTWGGVIGIWPRLGLNDGTYVTQPEFSFWFKDVGFDVENFGTKPDIEIDNTPKDFATGKDAQLDKAIQVGLQEIRKNPDLKPNFKTYPDLKLPKLPKS